MIRLQVTDAWIFLSIARSDGATLCDFFAAADHINNAIPTDQEIEGAVNRLSSCGLVLIQNDSFGLTEKGRALFERVGGLQAYPRRQWHIEPLLRQVAEKAEMQSNWRIDLTATATALRAYSKRVATFIRNRRKKK